MTMAGDAPMQRPTFHGSDEERDRLQRAYNALCGAEHDLEAIYPALTIKHELAGLRERLGYIAFPGAGTTTEVG